jgi:hypothetical protein
MAFTYNISDTTDISSMMRLELGDTVLEDGILPDQANFSDEELDYFYTQEGDDFWLAIARAFDAAAVVWARYPEVYHMGPEYQKIPASQHFAQRAQAARTKNLAPGVYAVEKDEIAMDLD